MDRRKLRVVPLVLALSALSLVVGTWLSGYGVGRWPVPGVLAAGMAAVTAGFVYVERTRRPLSDRWHFLAFWLPAVVVVGPILYVLVVARFWTVPSIPGPVPNRLGWYPIIFGVPLAYALGRATRPAWRWLVAATLAVLVAFDTVHLLRFGPADWAVTQLPDFALVLAVGTWAAIPLFHLGRTVDGPGKSSPAVRAVPAFLAALVTAVLLSIVVLGREQLFSLRFGPLATLAFYCSPIAYFALRAVRIDLDRRGNGVEG